MERLVPQLVGIPHVAEEDLYRPLTAAPGQLSVVDERTGRGDTHLLP